MTALAILALDFCASHRQQTLRGASWLLRQEGRRLGWYTSLLHRFAPHTLPIQMDINSSLPVPQFAIIDGIVGMEGNGPIQGDSKPCGALILGDDLVAVDATAARLMQIDPAQVTYLAEASRFLGNIAEENILQIGEGLVPFRQDFRLINRFQYLKTLNG